MRPLLILDKSWLQGASLKEIKRVASSWQLTISLTLFHEILTASSEERLSCFRKLKAVESRVSVVQALGDLLRFEDSERRSCLPLRNRLHAKRVAIDLGNPAVRGVFTPEGAIEIDLQRAILEDQMVNTWRKAWRQTSEWIPDLPILVKGGRRENLQEVYRQIASDSVLVKQVYSDVRRPWMPAVDLLDERWAYFRMIQVHLAAGIEYMRRWGSTADPMPKERVANYYLDLEYVILGILADALATEEIQLLEWFAFFAPDGKLISSSPRVERSA